VIVSVSYKKNTIKKATQKNVARNVMGEQEKFLVLRGLQVLLTPNKVLYPPLCAQIEMNDKCSPLTYPYLRVEAEQYFQHC